MKCMIALLRGINVGGKNIIKMADLKASFERRGFEPAVTYINSGNVLFASDLDESVIRGICEKMIAEDYQIETPVCILSAGELIQTLDHAPAWWGRDAGARHDAFFVLPPMTAPELCAHVGEIREEYENVGWHGRIIFWSAALTTFSRTRWSKISQDKKMYQLITVRNANTTLKLAQLAAAFEKDL